MKCLEVQRPQGSVFIALHILPFCNRHGKAKETIITPTNLFHHNDIFQLIKNLNNLTDQLQIE